MPVRVYVVVGLIALILVGLILLFEALAPNLYTILLERNLLSSAITSETEARQKLRDIYQLDNIDNVENRLIEASSVTCPNNYTIDVLFVDLFEDKIELQPICGRN